MNTQGGCAPKVAKVDPATPAEPEDPPADASHVAPKLMWLRDNHKRVWHDLAQVWQTPKEGEKLVDELLGGIDPSGTPGWPTMLTSPRW